jgi:hypothetical protein
MACEKLTAILAERVMGWSVSPDRFLKGSRGWMPRWRFRPEQNLNDSFQLLEAAKPERYAMGSENGGEFSVRVEITSRVGEARHSSKPRAITLAVARALGIEVEEDD